MHYVLGAGILALYIYLWYWVYTHNVEYRKPSTKSLSSKRIKRLKNTVSENSIQMRLKRLRAIADLTRQIPIIGYSDDKKKHLQSLIISSDTRDEQGRLKLPEEIYCIQFATGAVFFFGCILASFFTNPLAIGAVILTPLVMKFPLSGLEEGKEELSKSISEHMLTLFKLYYVQFIEEKTNSTLLSVIHSAIQEADDDSYLRVLTRIETDLQTGEDYAIECLDERFSENIKVHKFCVILKSRTQGERASFENMTSFLNELQEEYDAYFDHDLEKRSEKISSIINTYIMILFGIVMSIMLVGMVAGANK